MYNNFLKSNIYSSQEIKVEEEIIEHPKMTKEDIIQQLEEIKKIKEEEERKFVEEKRLQILKFVYNITNKN